MGSNLGNLLTVENLQQELRRNRDPKKAFFLQRYFKTGPGQYAEGDVFLGGITTVFITKMAGKYKDFNLNQIRILLHSKYHEERMVALGILKKRFEKGANNEKFKIYKFYLSNTKYINNWDLVDVTAPKIIGGYLLENPKLNKILNKLVTSKNIWERRIAVMSTFTFIKYGNFDKSFELAERLLNDKEDLIHKAAGWMLREIGKKDSEVEQLFIKKHYEKIPRTMLRYAIEKFPENLRLKYLKGKFN